MTSRVVNYGGGERLIQRIPLDRVQVTHNPRQPCPTLMASLAEEGFEGKSLLNLVLELALSDQPELRQRFVELVEKYEGYANGIVELAKSRAEKEIEPILLRPYRKGGVGEPWFGLVSGERRLLASAYNFAKTGDEKYRKIGADVQEMTLDMADRLAFAENMFRKQMTDLEIGEWLHAQRVKLNVKLTVIAEQNGMEYQFCRNRESLTYLPDNLKLKLQTGKLGVTEASKIGYEIKSGKRFKDGTKKEDGSEGVNGLQEHRAKMVTMKAAQELFDASRGESEDFLRGIAACMLNEKGKTPSLVEALRASNKRIAERQQAA